jgi:hypothetical protein
VKLVRKVRIGSRTRRIYAQTPFERVCASPASDPERIAELKRQQQQLDPFQLSRTIQAQLEHIFQLSQELAVRGTTQAPILQRGSELDIARKKNTDQKESSKQERGKMTARKSKKERRRVACYVS